MEDSELIKAFEALQQENQRLRIAYEREQQENTALRKELAAAHEQLATAREVFAQLSARIERLEGQASRDSHNSSKPPPVMGLRVWFGKPRVCAGRAASRAAGNQGIGATRC